MKSTTTFLILLVLIGSSTIIGCGPNADPRNASGENDVLDEAAYAAEWDAEQKRSTASLAAENR